MLGYNVLPTNTRVRLSTGQLVPIEDLSGSGPQGPQGEKGDQGDPGTVDTSNFYTRLQTDFALAVNRPTSNLSTGAKVYDAATNTIRNVVGQNGVQTFIYMDHSDPENPQNDALMIDGSGISGSSIDPNVATFEDNMTTTAISLKKPATAFLGLDVTNGIVADVLQATQVTTGSLSSSSATIVGNCGVSGTLTAGSLNAGIVTVDRLQATGSLPSSYPSAGAFLGLVPSVSFASLMLNSSNASKLSQIEMSFVGAPAPHASLVSDPSANKFEIRMGGNPKLSITSSMTVHSNLSCFDMTSSNLTCANDIAVGGNATISGTLTVNGSPVGGSSLSAMEGSGLTISGSDIKLDHGNWVTQGFADKVDHSGFNTNGNFWDGYSTYPSGHQTFYTNQQNAYIEFDIISDTVLINLTKWSTGGYIDVLLRESSAFGQYHFVNRIDTFQNAGNTYTQGTPQNGNTFHHAGSIISVLASNIQTGYDRIRIVNRKGELLCNAIYWLAGKVATTNNYFVHSDNIHGDPGSLSDARLKTEVTPIAGGQALDVLSRIRGCTYEREDLGQRRVGLIADEVETAIQELACDNIISSKWYNDGEYKTLDYGRLVALLIPAVTHLSKRVEDLERTINGTTTCGTG